MSREHPLLIVENDSVLSDLLTRNITKMGYSVTPVFHPRQALEAATARSFDVALLDGRLPEHDGVWLTRELKRRIANLQVVILSAHSDEVFRKQCIDGGAFAYLRKPCNLADLETTIKRAIEHRAEKRFVQCSGNASTHENSDMIGMT